MAPRRNILEGTVFNGVIRSGWVAELCVALNVAGGKLHTCCLGCGWIGRVEVMAAFKRYKLLLCLCDLGGVGVQDVCVDGLNKDFGLGSRRQRRWKLY